MKRTCSVIVLVLVILSAFFSSAVAGEKDVLRALEKLKAGVEAGVTYKKYSELLADAKTEINMLERKTNKNQCFMEAVEKSYNIYEGARPDCDTARDWERSAVELEAKFPDGTLENVIATMRTVARDYQEDCNAYVKKAAERLDEAYKCLE